MRKDAPAPPFRRLLIANRGEIALRVIRTCRELGIESVAVYSDADAGALHTLTADHAERIGPPPAAESYLAIEAILDAASRSGAEAIHPGYGFLSESAAFAAAVEDAGLVFVGPPAETLGALGDKLAARRAAAAAGVPIVPGLTAPLDTAADGAARAAAAEVGFPLLLKAAAGGGGRGMRRVDDLAGLAVAVGSARREAVAAFGDGTLYLERLVSPVRHVEVQLLGDRRGGLAVLGERDCSVQRRHQKLVEESPSPSVTADIRAALCDSARRVAGSVPFHSAATVEFLLDADGNHYFLEMNTRLQVEHGVTELVTGLDLVAWQILVASGRPLPQDVVKVEPRGHAIEVRLYAEDPFDGFRPTGGGVGTWRMPAGPGVRIDAGVTTETPVPSEYDPLLAKLLVHAADRPAAIARLRRALDETLIGGLQTSLPFHRWLVDQPAFVTGDHDTGLVAASWVDGPPLSAEQAALAALLAGEARRRRTAADAVAANGRQPAASSPQERAWARLARQEALRGGEQR